MLISNKNLFCLNLVVLIAITNCQTQKKCAAVNEYCQNHWDCCSNSCLSYSYRCVRTYMPENRPIAGQIEPVTNLDDLIGLQFGHKNNLNKNNNNNNNNDDNNDNNNNNNNNNNYNNNENNDKNVGSLDVRQEITDRIASVVADINSRFTHIDAVILLFNKNLHSEQVKELITTAAIAAKTEKTHNEVTTTKNAQQLEQKKVVMEIVDRGNADASADDALVKATNNVTMTTCKAIGAKCYSNDECCTKRCHGFLHQCVT